MATWDKIPVAEYTEAKVEGTGVFDVLMKATAAHLEQEFNKTRIRGPEYATVYLGAIESVQRTALEFLVQQNKLAIEAQVLQTQLEIAKINLQIAQQNLLKIPAEIELLEAQAKLTNQQAANAIIEGTVLSAQKCKLDAEYDVLVGTKLKVVAETSLLNQKVATEKAQTIGAGIDPTSVVGKQITLYTAQADGFKRDAEQKAAKIMIDTWNVRRTTDEGTDVNTVNKLDDPAIGRAVSVMLTGINA